MAQKRRAMVFSEYVLEKNKNFDFDGGRSAENFVVFCSLSLKSDFVLRIFC
jgi:hypothetical protein